MSFCLKGYDTRWLVGCWFRRVAHCSHLIVYLEFDKLPISSHCCLFLHFTALLSLIRLRLAADVVPVRTRRPLLFLLCRLQAQLAMEEDKRRRWADENVRRRTDYIPLAFQLLTALAQKGQLQPLVERAKEAHKAKREQQQQKAGGSS